MRDQDERQRQFVVRPKRDSEYDEPSVKRRSFREDDEDDGKARPGFFARRSMREREEEEEEESRFRTQRRSRRVQEEEEEFDDDEEDEGRKAPMIVRVFAWLALLAILFAVGYLGANYFFSWADKKGGPRVGEVYGSGTEVTQSQPAETAKPEAAASNSESYTVYVPENGDMNKRSIEIRKGLVEEDMEKVASVYLDAMKETNSLGGDVRLLNVFQSGDWLYLDVTEAFQSSIKKLGKDKGSLVITGLVKTMKENFPPVSKIKFYINGKESTMKTPVDLTQPWEIR